MSTKEAVLSREYMYEYQRALLPVNSNTLASSFSRFNLSSFFVEWMEFPHCRVCITNFSPWIYIYTPILQIPCAENYCWYEHIYMHISIVVALNLLSHVWCINSIQVDGMSTELVSAWYEPAPICVTSWPDSDSSYTHCLGRHIDRYHQGSKYSGGSQRMFVKRL